MSAVLVFCKKTLPYGAAKQLLSALHRRRTALYGADFAALIAPVPISLFDAALRGAVRCAV